MQRLNNKNVELDDEMNRLYIDRSIFTLQKRFS